MKSKLRQFAAGVLVFTGIAVGCGTEKPGLFSSDSLLPAFSPVPSQSEPEIDDDELDTPTVEREID